MYKTHDMKRLALTLIGVALLSAPLLSQTKITIEDRQQILTPSIRTSLALKFEQLSLELTDMVDFSNKCDYLFGSISEQENGIVFKVKNCDDVALGSKSISKSILDATVDEQVVVYYYNFRSIIENPEDEVYIVETQITPKYNGPIQTEHDSRYFFSPSAYTLKQGEFYYNTLYFFLHDIQVGLSDQFSLGLGTTIVGIPMYINAKVGFQLGEKTQLAFGDMAVLGTYDVDFFGNLAYATITRGSKDTNISLSVGALSTTDNDVTDETFSMVYNLSGMVKASDYIYFVTENYFFGYNKIEYAYFYGDDFNSFIEERYSVRDHVLFGITGVRIIRKKNELASWQFGLSYVSQIYGEYPSRFDQPGWDTYQGTGADLIAFPMIAYTLKFKLD
jgi:hypothetical protein